ncbi:methylmalonyl-CoA mutase family protein [Pseudonocardia sp.]|uniref:methylmalonyl-CoA mutase family protein n=1 Tax=Pseudonocardia sp. TaxID=60912 RepID=UPI002615199C|nr:methylmalonyl-CoA mutase family protein [Pseudonocardia sp.]
MPEAELPDLTLAAEFPTPTAAEWTALVDGVLRKARRIPDDAPAGAGVEKLVRTGPDGIAVRPLYTAADAPAVATGVPGGAPFVRGGSATGPVPAGWDVRQRHDEPDADAARAAVTADLENGVTSIWLAATTPADLPHVLGDVLLDLAPVVLDAGPGDQAALAEAFLALPGEPAGRLGTLGLDPVGARARTGSSPAVDSVVELALRVADGFPRVRAVVVDALPVHTAGGSDAQELGFALAAGVEYLRVLTAAGLDVAAANRLCEFRLAATAEQFPTIAKLRAARRLWSRATQACGSAEPAFVHAVSSPTMLTRRDPYVNLLRGTLAGFAAGVGGADAVTVAPFDAAIGASEAFSRRIARNTQALLVEESHLARVLDPAGGSWYVESLTDELARAAWAFFQEIESAGGAVAALDAGLVAERTAAVRAGRERAVATRRTALTGVSEFPDLAEQPVERRPLPDAPSGGLPVYRPAQAFEAFRDRSDALLAERGARPRAFLATLGPLAAYTARAGFTRNLLAAGGIETVEAGPTETAEDVRAAFAASGAGVAVLCSTDALYAERAADTVAALREAGATRILLAGRGEFDGVDGQLHAGCDALAVVAGLHESVAGQEVSP